MKKKMTLFLSTILSVAMAVPAMANSAQTYFEGISPTGTIFTGEQSPIVVEQEVLTFDLQELPLEYYSNKEEYLAYSGKVTAEYTFRNPSDMDITVEMAFPFGRTPDYGYSYDHETEERVYGADGEKYAVTVDGEPVERTIRHTLFHQGEDFELEKDLSRMTDGYMADDFYYPDLTVTKYSWQIDGIDEAEFSAARLGFWWDGDSRERKLMLMEQSGGENKEDKIAVTRWVENGDTIELFVFGDPLEEEIQWFSENGSEDTPFDYTLTFLGTESTTYEEYVFAGWEDGILREDWYNATTQELRLCEWDFGILGSFEYSGTLWAEDLLRWYTYEMTIPAGATVVNTVTAPMYPSVNTRYEPPIYLYEYLLSPAKTWAAFGELDIIVNTPYYMTESSLGFEKTETGYEASLDGLPEGELTFTLSEDPSPRAPGTPPAGGIFMIFILLLIPMFMAVKKKKEK